MTAVTEMYEVNREESAAVGEVDQADKRRDELDEHLSLFLRSWAFSQKDRRMIAEMINDAGSDRLREELMNTLRAGIDQWGKVLVETIAVKYGR